MSDIFLSYSREDAAIMHRLRNDLRNAGFTVWTDETGLEPGTPSWQHAIEEAIANARCMVVILSPSAKQSEWVGNELSYAEQIEIPVFPVLAHGDVGNAVPISLINTQFVDIRSEYGRVETQLLPALRRHGRKKEPSKEPANGAKRVLGIVAVGVVLLIGLYGVVNYMPPFNPPLRPTPNLPATATARAQSGRLVVPPTVTDTPLPAANTETFAATITAQALAAATVEADITPRSLRATAGAAATLTAQPTPIPKTLATPVVDDMGVSWVNVPAGEFIMGSADNDEAAINNEKPQHTFYLDAYWIMQTEVTNAQYTYCVNGGACTEPHNERWKDEAYGDHPVIDVTWYQAKEYATWIGGSLPTEAEWEKACRGTDGRIYPWGDELPTTELANFDSIGPTLVGSYPDGASPYGLYDMAGNVYEWTADWYDYNYYDVSPARTPTAPVDGDYRTLRGGSWVDYDDGVRCANRDRFIPDGAFVSIGFRVVRHETVKEN